MKSELFLTSSIHAVAHDIAKKVDVAKASKLVFIGTAVELKAGDLSWFVRDRQSLIDAGFNVADYTITGKTKDQLKRDLHEFDYIYMSGGDTAYLLKQSRKSGFISVIKELVNENGKTYIGTSAGSIICGPKLPDYFRNHMNDDLVDENCYGFVNFTLLPHWGSEDFRKKYLGSRLERAYREDQVPLIILTDNQYVHIINNSMTIIDVKV